MRVHRVRALLMGGQACVFYGAAEFSRDTDLAILADAANVARLRRALDELNAEPIAVPSLELRHLRKGHAVHFRCMHPEATRMRVDIMSRMRGVDAFPSLWRRRRSGSGCANCARRNFSWKSLRGIRALRRDGLAGASRSKPRSRGTLPPSAGRSATRNWPNARQTARTGSR